LWGRRRSNQSSIPPRGFLGARHFLRRLDHVQGWHESIVTNYIVDVDQNQSSISLSEVFDNKAMCVACMMDSQKTDAGIIMTNGTVGNRKGAVAGLSSLSPCPAMSCQKICCRIPELLMTPGILDASRDLAIPRRGNHKGTERLCIISTNRGSHLHPPGMPLALPRSQDASPPLSEHQA